MAASLVTRSHWTDDDGSGTTGTIINEAQLQLIFDEIDLLISGTGAYAVLSVGGKFRIEGAGLQLKGNAAPAVSAAGEAVLYVDSTKNALMLSENALPFSPLSYILDRQLSLQTVVNTVTKTAVYTYAIPGGLVGTNRRLKLRGIADVLNNSGGTCTMNVEVKLGATVIYVGAFTNVNTSATRGSMAIDCDIFGAGATNAQRSETSVWFDGVASGNLSGTAPAFDFVGGGGSSWTIPGGRISKALHTSIAEDLTVSKNLVVSFQNGTANAAIDMRLHVADVELK